MKVAYFDCFSGAAGDMILAASLECGLKLSALKKELLKLKLPTGAYALLTRKVSRCALKATYFEVKVGSRKSRSRTYEEIRKLIEKSRLSGRVKSQAGDIFRRLGQVEAKRHGITLQRVHFHEVGWIDSIVDVVGAAIAMEALGIEKVYAGNVHLGTGVTQTQHGSYPVPAPATLELFKGRAVQLGGPQAELMTPTGAAILTTLVDRFDESPVMEISRIGYGAGRRDFKERPNVLRLTIGQTDPAFEEDRVTLLEANVDDMLPLNYEMLYDSLFKKGALDVALTPIQMKKQRPAIQISVLCSPSRRKRIAQYLLEETTTFGVRFADWGRYKFRRKMSSVQTAYGNVSVKLGFMDGYIVRAMPEYEDCKRLASRKAVPFLRVYQRAQAEAARQFLEK